MLATTVREVCGLGTEPVSREERDALVTSHLFVRFTPGADRNGDTLDFIEALPSRQDRSFSIIGRGRIERLSQFITENTASVAG